MEFCIISPIAGLERYGKLSRRHLLLAQYCHNEKYLNWYAQRKLAGDHLILDNGTYENSRPMDDAQMVNFAETLQPQVLVLPDLLGQPWLKTTSAALRFLDDHGDRLAKHAPRTEFMFVPQATNEDDWFRSFTTVLHDGRQGHKVTWIGIGRYVCSWQNYESHRGRALLAKQVRSFAPHVKIHALGMNNGDTEELKHLAEAGVTSVDSSSPVWRGWNGYTFNAEDRVAWDKEGTPCNMHASGMDLDNLTDSQIKRNLEVCGVRTS